MDLEQRARSHAALGDSRRLAIVDHLSLGDHTVADLADLTGLPGNLLAHHLRVMETAGLIERRGSEGDHRRKYVTLQWDLVPAGPEWPGTPRERVAFVCTANSARSQFAAAVWSKTTGSRPYSAGSHPAGRVHPRAVEVAAEHGIDLSAATTRGYGLLPRNLDLIVSVCDRAFEEGVPAAPGLAHWSVPDPVPAGTLTAFRTAFAEIARRVERLAGPATSS